MKKFVLSVAWMIVSVIVGIPVLFFGFGGFAGAILWNFLTEDRPVIEGLVFSCLCWGTWLVAMSYILSLL